MRVLTLAQPPRQIADSRIGQYPLVKFRYNHCRTGLPEQRGNGRIRLQISQSASGAGNPDPLDESTLLLPQLPGAVSTMSRQPAGAIPRVQPLTPKEAEDVTATRSGLFDPANASPIFL